jgi:hypothetical protein
MGLVKSVSPPELSRTQDLSGVPELRASSDASVIPRKSGRALARGPGHPALENATASGYRGPHSKTIQKTVQEMIQYPPDFDADTVELCRAVAPFTMTSKYAVYALRLAVRHLVHSRIPGDIVECGVWKGGSMMAVARTLLQLNSTERKLHLFDTFDQMSEPTEVDRTVTGQTAAEILALLAPEPGKPWTCCTMEEARANVLSTGYPAGNVALIKGKVEETIPAAAPAEIALLRLDTDWFESTDHELKHLYPRLSRGGILIVDDYGYWQGARKAVDQYIAENQLQLLLTRVDDSARMCIRL